MESFLHPQERVKAFIKKIKDAEDLAKGPKLVLDKDASKRFIHNALSSDQVYVDAVKSKKGGQGSASAKQDTSKTDGNAAGKGKRASSKSSGKKNKRQRKN
jgi:phosphosulfolactate synthase (CoM biosynthesis protein A)